MEILQLLDRISDTTLSVLITGETGSGKELVARSIHDHSRRRKGPFVAVNCGAIPENLIESELFGYRAGAFTGATRDKRGLVEEAGGGTLFLDEIAELPQNTQVKLLRVLQEKEIRRLGDTQATAVDIRVLAATNRDVSEWLKEGKFREDLYYRVAQMILHVPGLRERKEDLLLLAEHFLGESAKELGLSKPPRLHKDLLEKMMEYDWPGNVRELENFLRTAAAFADRGAIHTGNLPAFLLNKLKEKLELRPISPPSYHTPNSELRTPNSKPIPPRLSIPPSPLTWDQYEAALFARTLLKHEMNCEKAATELGVGVATVYLKMRKYGLKQNAAKYEHLQVPIPEGMTAAALKQKLIQETYQREAQSPYAVAKQLNLNVGTVYRYLKETT